MSAKTQAKTTRLLAEGRVRPDDIRELSFAVQGDNGTYRVGLSCDCKASGSCSHLQAVLAWVTADPEERKIMRQIVDAHDEIAAEKAGQEVCRCGHVADWHAEGGKGECEHDGDANRTRPGDCACREFCPPLTDEQRAAGEAAFKALS